MADATEAVARAIYEEDDVWHKAFPWPNPNTLGAAAAYRRLAQAAIAAHTKALVDGAGEIKRLLRWWGVDGVAGDRRMLVEAATTIAALGAENERLRVALHDAIRRPMGVVPASADEFYSPAEADAAEQRRIARSAALSDLIAGDADMIDGGDDGQI